MAQANPVDNSIAQDVLRESEESLGPTLRLEKSGYGYIEADQLEKNERLFSKPISSLEEYDSLTDENIVLRPQQSARVLENYFGQHSRTDEELEEFLEQFDIAPPDLGDNIVMELDIDDYDGKQHVNYHEGKVARELVEYLDKDSSWSSQTYFMEECGKLFIQNSP